MSTTDNTSKDNKKGLKTVAETAATTATIVVSGKTIASVIDSGVDAIKGLDHDDAVAEPENITNKDIENTRQTPETSTISQQLRSKHMTSTAESDAVNDTAEKPSMADTGEEEEFMSVFDTELTEDCDEENHIQILGTEPIGENLMEESQQNPEGVSEDVTNVLEDDHLYNTMETGESYRIEETGKDCIADTVGLETGDLQDMSFSMNDIIM